MPEKRLALVPASNFCGTLSVNVDNHNLSDADFRQFVRNTLPIVIFDRPIKQTSKMEFLTKA